VRSLSGTLEEIHQSAALDVDVEHPRPPGIHNPRTGARRVAVRTQIGDVTLIAAEAPLREARPTRPRLVVPRPLRAR